MELPNRFDFRGHKIAWGTTGQGSPLVLVHGTPFSSQVWRKIAPLLATRWKVYYFDLLGYGLSDKPDADVSLGVQNQLLVDMLRFWELERPDVLCHDFGGSTVLRAHFLNGVQYRSVTIFDAVALAPWGSPFVAHVRHYEEAFRGLPAYAHKALLREYLQTSAHKKLSEEALDLYMKPWLTEEGQAGFYRQIAQMDQKFTDEVEPQYQALNCPTQVLWGEEDNWIPFERGKVLSNLIANGRLTAIPNAGHLVQEDAPEAIVAAMLNPSWDR